MPSERRGTDSARSRASAKSGKLTITDAEVTTPAAATSTIPVLTPREIPKSSALMMRRVALGVDPTRAISTDVDHVHQHLRSVPGERNRAWLVAVVEVHGDLLDLQPVEPRDEETLQIETKSTQRLP